MSFWGRLFGSDDATNKVIDHVSSGLDKLWYTDEEKADDARRDNSEARKFLITWLTNTQGQNLARRFIAVSCTIVWLFMYCISWIMAALAPWLEVYASRLMESSAVIASRAESMNGAMMLILGFYFAAPYMGEITKTAMNKFSGSNEK